MVSRNLSLSKTGGAERSLHTGCKLLSPSFGGGVAGPALEQAGGFVASRGIWPGFLLSSRPPFPSHVHWHHWERFSVILGSWMACERVQWITEPVRGLRDRRRKVEGANSICLFPLSWPFPLSLLPILALALIPPSWELIQPVHPAGNRPSKKATSWVPALGREQASSVAGEQDGGGGPAAWPARFAEVPLSSGTACDPGSRAPNDEFNPGVQQVVNWTGSWSRMLSASFLISSTKPVLPGCPCLPKFVSYIPLCENPLFSIHAMFWFRLSVINSPCHVPAPHWPSHGKKLLLPFHSDCKFGVEMRPFVSPKTLLCIFTVGWKFVSGFRSKFPLTIITNLQANFPLLLTQLHLKQ